MSTKLDVICIGRSSVDLYGAQIGGRLEDMASFSKYIGGSPTNISIGSSRLGLASAVITRVGDEHMGRFIREQLIAEGVNIDYVITDKDRLSALVILGIRNEDSFPLIFYRENCADMALCEDDITPEFIQSAKAVLVTGTHFSTPSVSAASMKAMNIARAAGRKVAFDIDYRPNLWALGGHGDGESRFAESDFVTAHLQNILPHCDLIVGTEEEWQIAGGSRDTLDALQKARTLTSAVIVCKRGAMGCVVFEGDCTSWGDGVSVPVQEIEVFNVLGAGDGFMSGFLRGWLRDEPLETSALYANICGALAVSRHGCAPAYPSFKELQYFIENGSEHLALRHDKKLSQIHLATTRRKRYGQLYSFAFDHRVQFEEWANKYGRSHDDIGRLKELALDAALQAGKGQSDIGILVDDRLGRKALHKASDHDLWIGRPIEQSGVFPLAFEEGPDLGSALAEWPANHCVKVLVPLRLDDDEVIRQQTEEKIITLADACRQTGHELLLEIINGRNGKAAEADQIMALMKRFYELGVYPDWWKLEPLNDAGFWQKCGDIVRDYDPDIQGIIVLGKEMDASQLEAVFYASRTEPLVNGFAIGRTIFADVAQLWLSGEIDDNKAISLMADKFETLIGAWNKAN